MSRVAPSSDNKHHSPSSFLLSTLPHAAVCCDRESPSRLTSLSVTCSFSQVSINQMMLASGYSLWCRVRAGSSSILLGGVSSVSHIHGWHTGFVPSLLHLSADSCSSSLLSPLLQNCWRCVIFLFENSKFCFTFTTTLFHTSTHSPSFHSPLYFQFHLITSKALQWKMGMCYDRHPQHCRLTVCQSLLHDTVSGSIFLIE